MEQSKLVSLIIANFKVAYPYYFKDLSNEEFLGMISLYQENFNDCNEQLLIQVIKKIIRKNKFMPSIAEILEQYKMQSREYYKDLLNSSSIDSEEKGYLISMVDWYSIQEEYPKEILNRLNELDAKRLSTTKREAITYDNKTVI